MPDHAAEDVNHFICRTTTCGVDGGSPEAGHEAVGTRRERDAPFLLPLLPEGVVESDEKRAVSQWANRAITASRQLFTGKLNAEALHVGRRQEAKREWSEASATWRGGIPKQQ